MSQVPGLGHVIFYRHPGRYPTLFHWLETLFRALLDAPDRGISRVDKLHCPYSIKGRVEGHLTYFLSVNKKSELMSSTWK
jgi:hypothetical protein